jgi:hypothetical protein
MIHGTRQMDACSAEGETLNTNNFVGQFTPMLCWPTWSQMFMHAHILPHPTFERWTRQLVPLKSTFLSYRSNSWFQVKKNRYSCYVHRFWPNPESLGISIFRVAPKPQTLGKGACNVTYSQFPPLWVSLPCTILGQSLIFEDWLQSRP